MDSRPPPSPSPSPASSLSSLLPILNAFNHRHHNQHRLAHWWPVFRILRRTLRALVDDLAHSPSSSTSTSTSRPRREASASASAPSPPPRAIWLSKHFIPRAYIAFSQLAADNQHAPLGLLLLAILSRVHAVLAQLLPDHATPSSTTPSTKTPSVSNDRSMDAANPDKGVAISRETLPPPAQPTERLRAQPETSARGPSDEPRGGDAGPEAVTTMPSKAKSKEASSKNDKKKKKKKGKGDELSSLFGSLA